MVDRFELPADLTIYAVTELRDAMLAWIANQPEKATAMMNLSARQVESVDGAGLQLVASLGSLGIRWQLCETSPAFSEACATMGLSDWLARVDSLSAGGSS